jgi:hypothetical protein
MHDLLLQALFARHRRTTPAEQVCFLRELQPAARALFRAYRPGWGKRVSVSYQQPATQAAYLLRYFSHYASVTRRLLQELEKWGALSLHHEPLCISIFGCGPAPELCGLLQFLRQRERGMQQLYAYLFDIANPDWSYAQRIILQVAASHWWDRRLFTAFPLTFDLRQPPTCPLVPLPEHVYAAVRQSHLVTLQNCCNEIATESYDAVHENLLAILQALRPGNVLLLVDRYGYSAVADLLTRFATTAVERKLAFPLIMPNHKRIFECQDLVTQMPVCLRNHFFDGSADLTPAQVVQSRCLALRRR